MAHARGKLRILFRSQTTRWMLPAVLILGFAGACGKAPKKETREPPLGWRAAVTFSGRGDRQTDSFDIDNGYWRVKWETKNENPPGQGRFKLTIHSAISGRPLMELVNHKGAGNDTAYVAEDPRLYFMVIESANVDWSVTVEESVMGEAQNSAPGAVRYAGLSSLPPR